jgi:hypothetical protein
MELEQASSLSDGKTKSETNRPPSLQKLSYNPAIMALLDQTDPNQLTPKEALEIIYRLKSL